MKQLLIIIAIFYMSNSFAQNANHACSSLKIKQFNNSQSKVSKSQSVYQYDMKFVKLDLEVSNLSTFISGSCTHKVAVLTSGLATFTFELIDQLVVSSVTINGVSANFIHVNDELNIDAPNSILKNDLVDIQINYSGTPPQGSGFNSSTGLFNSNSPSWGTQVTWTLSEPFVANTWWPCKQILEDKIDSTILIFTVDNNLKVGSNGLLIDEINLPSNKKKFIWKSNYPIAYYLISFACAPYQEYSFKVLLNGATDSMLVQNFIYPNANYLTTFENDILETGDMLHHFSEKFGLYPFANEKYGHCIAPLGGGMEHQTMTTQGYFANWLTAHELGHQWWGNNVTCSTWNDIWLNEGFASYSEYIYYQEFASQSDADNDMLDRHNNIMSQPGGSVYVYDISSSSRIFDNRLTYDKGAAVVHMIRNFINNDPLFFKTLKKYQETFKNATTNTGDFINLILQETSIDLTEFLNSWVYGEGFPIYSGVFNTQNDTVFVRVNQTSSVINNPTTYPSMLDIQLFFEDGTSEVYKVENSLNIQAYYFLSGKTVDSVFLDPNNWIINQQEVFQKDVSFSFEVVSKLLNLENDIFTIINPFQNLIKIQTKENFDIQSIYIVNSMGKQVFIEENLLSNQFQINTSLWNKGVYLITINNRFTLKLLKN